MRAACINYEQPIGRAVHPDAVFLLPFGIYAECVVGGITDFENCRRLKQGSRKKEPQKRNEPRTEETRYGAPHKTTASLINPARGRPDRRHASSRRGFRGAY